MAFFQFKRKLDVVKEYSFEEIPIFSSLSPAEHRLIEKKVRLVEFKKGDLVYQEGTPADAFYVIVSGRFHAFTKTKNNSSGETLLYLYRGDHFGETSLLTGKHHSAFVEAKSDGLVLRIEKDDFLKFVQEIPAISLHLSRSLGHRLTKSGEAGSQRREVKIAAFYEHSGLEGGFQFWIDMATDLARRTARKTIVIDFVTSPDDLLPEEFRRKPSASFDLVQLEPSRESDLKPCLMEHPGGFTYLHAPVEKLQDKDEKKISTLLTVLTYRYDYLLLRLVPDLNYVTFKALKQSDMVYVYCAADIKRLNACAETVISLQQNFGFSKSEIKIILPEGSAIAGISFEEKERVLGNRIFAILASKVEQPDRYQSTIRYLTREFSGTLIGLALGSGAAFGLAHIGVLRVLEKENIPVDVISGSSIGALVGALWAAGMKADDLEVLARGINKRTGFFKLLGFRDLSIAHMGFFKGNQITRFLESYIGNKTFQDLQIPVKIIAANLLTSEKVVLESGRVVDAIRASIGIPGIFRPLFYRGDYLIDGGVIDPLPVRVLAKMGVKKIISVNVLASPKDREERNRFMEKRRREELRNMANQNFFKKASVAALYRFNERYTANIFNVIMNTIQFMEYELAQISGNEADVLIHPEVPEAHWAEFYHPDQFIRAGEEKTREHLAEIKQLLVE
jgi:NTE family protein